MRYGISGSSWLGAFSFPQLFLTDILQRHSRVHRIPIDCVSFALDVLENEPKSFPEVGVNIHGFSADGVRWNPDKKSVDDQELGQIYDDIPDLHLKPTNSYTKTGPGYHQWPMSITAQREGVLSVTGTSTNFVIALPLPTREPPDQWIQREHQ
jgi:dynein heavy chain